MEPSKIDQALFRAVEKGDIQAVQERLRKGADVNTRLGQLGKGYTRLFDPYWMNPAEMSAWTPLMAAVNRGFAEIVRILLESGADIEAAEPNGLTALCHAARAGQLEIARLLLQWGANTFARRFDGHTLLHLATSHGHNGMMELLLDHGMDVNITNDDGDTALHIAAEYGQKEVVHLLLQRGANIQAMNHAGETALWEPIFRTHPILNRPDYTHLDVITLLRESGIRPTFREAIALGDVRVGLEWISGGADLNAPVWRDMTPLALACSHGQAAFARMLIEDYLNVPDIASLYNAVQSGSLETVELLLTTREWSQKALFYALLRSLGCKDGRISDRVGLQIEDWKPMIAYAHEDHADIDALTIYLLRIGRVDKTDRALIQKAFGYALLSIGCPGLQNTRRVQALLDFGADCRDLLSYAVLERCPPEIVQILLNHGADVNAVDANFGTTAIQNAVDNDHLEVVQVLLNRGAIANLEAAAMLGEEALLEVLLQAQPSQEELDSALLKAIRHHHVPIVRRLLDAGADPNLKRWRENSSHAPPDAGEVSLEEDDSPWGDEVASESPWSGSEALWAAVGAGFADTYQILIAYGATIEPRPDGSTLLHMAAIHNRIEVARLLLETEIPLDALDRDGNTAWSLARINGNEELAALIEQRQSLTSDNL